MSGAHQTPGDFFSDICDGEYYCSHPVFQLNDRALQVIAYYDEVTLTSPLMSRAHKYKIGNL